MPIVHRRYRVLVFGLRRRDGAAAGRRSIIYNVGGIRRGEKVETFLSSERVAYTHTHTRTHTHKDPNEFLMWGKEIAVEHRREGARLRPTVGRGDRSTEIVTVWDAANGPPSRGENVDGRSAGDQ